MPLRENQRSTLSVAMILLVVLVLAGMSSVPVWGNEDTQAGDENSFLQAPPESVAAWRDLKFGLFIHWGPVSLKGTEIGWSRGGERRGTGGTGEIPVEVYDNLYKQFNPVAFEAGEWVKLAEDAGMRYLVFTSRHHDGFSNFDSRLTDYKITSPDSPYGKDIVKQLADACHASRLRFGLYYSQPDWHHPDYRTDNHSRYLEYLHGQVRELCTRYGRLDILFFDGLSGTAEDWNAPPLFRMIRSLQPNIIINDRCGLPADYETPEQKIGSFNRQRPWETCMTLCNQWAWKPDDEMKSLKQCLRTLVSVVGGDGNLLFNVGPMPDGRIEPRQADRLREMGQWLSKYGESLYGTRGGPYQPGDWGVSTCKEDLVFLHLYSIPEEGVRLPLLPARLLEACLLQDGQKKPLIVKQDSQDYVVQVAKEDRDEIDTIVVLKFDQPTQTFPVVER